jgi:hypothetical protein
MEKITNRDKYTQNFFEFCNKVQITEELIEALSKHRYFSDDMKTVLVNTKFRFLFINYYT